MAYLSDIEIAQSCRLRPIAEIAEKAHVDEKYLEPYGKNKAKIDLSLLDETKRENGRLVLVTAIGVHLMMPRMMTIKTSYRLSLSVLTGSAFLEGMDWMRRKMPSKSAACVLRRLPSGASISTGVQIVPHLEFSSGQQ